MAQEFSAATQELVRSTGFQNLEPTEQIKVMKRFIGQRQQAFGGLGLIEQDAIARRSIESHAPSAFARVGAGVRKAGEVVSELPIIKPALQITGLKEPPEEVRPFTELLMKGVLTGAGPGMIPPSVAGQITEEMLESPTGRAGAELTRDVAELGALFTGAAGLVRGVGARILPSGVEAAGSALRAGTAATAETFAKEAAGQALKKSLVERVATDFTVGELFGVVDALETQELRPLEQFVINPLAIAGLGLVLFGAGRALNRFGPVRVQEAARALEQDIGLQGIARDAQQFTNVFRRSTGLGREEAGEVVFKAARGTLSDAEFTLIRDTIVKNPRLLGNDFGLHLARQLRPKLQTKVEVADESLTVLFEDIRTRRETSVRPTSAKEATELAKRAAQGEIRILRARGRDADVRPFLPERPSASTAPVEVAEGTEPISSQLEAGLERLGIAPAEPRKRPVTEVPVLRGPEQGPSVGPLVESRAPSLRTAGDLAEARAGVAPPIQERSILLDQFGRPIPGIKPTVIEGATAEALEISNPRLRSAVELAERKTAFVGQPRPLQLETRPVFEGPGGRQVSRPEVSAAERRAAKPFSVLNNRAKAADVEFTGTQAAFGKPAGLAQFRDPKTGFTFELPTSRATLSAIRAAKKQAGELAPRIEPPVKPQPGSAAEIEGGGGKVEVLDNSPQGTAVRLPSGEVAIGEPKVSGRVGIHKEALERPPPGAPRPTLSEREITDLKTKPTTLRSPDKLGRKPRTFRTTPNPVYDTVTVIESQTREPLTVRSSVLINWVREGKYLPAERDFARMSNEELARVHQALFASERQIDKANPLFSERFREVQERRVSLLTEWLRRKGALDQPVSTAEGQLMTLFRKAISDERGAVDFEKLFGRVSERPAGALRSLPENDIVAVDAKLFGGRALVGPQGEIVLEFKVGNQTLPFTFRNRVEADSALRQVATSQLEQARIGASVERQVQARKLDEPAADLDLADLHESIRVDQILYGGRPAQPSEIGRYSTGRTELPEAIILPVETMLRRFGPAGNELADMFRRVKAIQEPNQGKDILRLRQEMRRLSKQERRDGMFDVIEDGVSGRQVVRDAHTVLVNRGLEQHASLKSIGVSVAPLEDPRKFMPHKFDILSAKNPKQAKALNDELVEQGFARNPEEALELMGAEGLGSKRDTVVQNIIDRDVARRRGAGVRGPKPMTRTEAESIFERFIAEWSERIAGSLERSRIDAKGYIRNAEKAWQIYFTQNNRRIAQAQVFGSKDDKAYELIDQIYKEAGSRSSRFARQVFDLEIGRVREPIEGVWRALYNWQMAKLSFSYLPNAVQTLSIGSRTNEVALIKAMQSTIRSPIQAFEHALEVGALPAEILQDIQEKGMADLTASVLERVTTAAARSVAAPFRFTEEFWLRPVAVKAGEIYFWQQVKALQKNPANKLAARRLDELFKSPKMAEVVSKANSADLTEMSFRAGKFVSDQTQFKSDIQSLPLWRNSFGGRFFFQLKTFLINHVRLVWRELNFKEHRDLPRFTRALATFFVAYPAAGVAISQIRKELMGETLTTGLIDDAFGNPTFENVLGGYVAAWAGAGAIGIVSDIVLTMMLSNPFLTSTLAIAPAAGTLTNGLNITSSVAHGILTADPKKFEKAARLTAREFGGLGAIAEKAVLGEP